MLEYSGPIHYLTHHEVINEENQSTPLGIVFNASANYNGQVLTNFWAKGPDLLNNPLGIVMRFREERFVKVGDIKKMYHSVKYGYHISTKWLERNKLLLNLLEGKLRFDIGRFFCCLLFAARSLLR